MYEKFQARPLANLAVLDRRAQALALIDRLSAINPDDAQLRAFIDHGTYAGQHCDLYAGQHCDLHAEPATAIPSSPRPLTSRPSR